VVAVRTRACFSCSFATSGFLLVRVQMRCFPRLASCDTCDEKAGSARHANMPSTRGFNCRGDLRRAIQIRAEERNGHAVTAVGGRMSGK